MKVPVSGFGPPVRPERPPLKNSFARPAVDACGRAGEQAIPLGAGVSRDPSLS